MRIAYITDETFPNRDASGHQIIQTLSALARAGAAVEMVFPARPRLAPGGTASPAELRAELEGFYHVECGFGLRALPTWLGPKRAPTKVAHALAATAAALARPADVIYTRNLFPIVPCLGAGRPVLFETYRPLTRQFAWSAAPFRAVGRHPRFVGIVTHSKLAREAFVADGLPPERVQTVYNGFDPGVFGVAQDAAAARARLGLAERPTVVYTGRIGAVKNLDLLLDAAERLPESQWALAGAIDTEEARPYVERAAKLPHVHLLGYRTGPELATVLQAADVLLVPPSADPLTRFGTTVLPIKLFTYLAAGRAIVAGRLPDAMELLADDENAVLVPPDDRDALVAGLRGLLLDPARAARLGAAAAATAAALTWQARAERLLAFIDGRLAAMPAR